VLITLGTSFVYFHDSYLRWTTIIKEVDRAMRIYFLQICTSNAAVEFEFNGVTRFSSYCSYIREMCVCVCVCVCDSVWWSWP